MSFTTGPYRDFTSLPSPDSVSMRSSRKIDFATRRYVEDDNGEFESMPDVVQRVTLAVSFAAQDSKFITPSETAAAEDGIRAALSSMATGRNPEIRIVRIASSSPRGGVVRRIVEFIDLATGRPGTVAV